MSNKDNRPAPSAALSYSTIRVRKPTANRLKTIISKINRKTYGRKVTATDVVEVSLSLLGETELMEIEQSTYSNQDRLDIEYKQFCKKSGKVSFL